MFVFKILIKGRGRVQLLADCCAELLKDQQMWTCCFLNICCVKGCKFFIFLLGFTVSLLGSLSYKSN